jgi:GNAT superfamily N-acetyltransferase
MDVTQLKALPWDHLEPLIQESLAQGFDFVNRLVTEYASGANRFDQPGEALFGVYDGQRLIAVGGLNRDPYLQDGQTGRVRHVYVLSTWRRQGARRRLVQRIIEEARLHYRRL